METFLNRMRNEFKLFLQWKATKVSHMSLSLKEGIGLKNLRTTLAIEKILLFLYYNLENFHLKKF